jgi:methionyl-tRNA formyltransferase
MSRPRAVVFAYHNVGVRCLKVLLDGGVDVPLVVTHRDSATENVWFGSVESVARDCGIPTITPDDVNTPAVAGQIRALAPDFLFSFYFRQMLQPALLAIPTMGALNMHGSLLPRFRGRAPVNWAVLRGETRTGASLHYMVEKPDAGGLVSQVDVPILADDTAHEVFEKVTVAAELALWKVLPALIAGRAPRIPLELAAGSYFGGRRPEDGRIDWAWPARRIHDLVRAVAPPYPGAFGLIGDARLGVGTSRMLSDAASADVPASGAPCQPRLALEGEQLVLNCTDGGRLWLREITLDGHRLELPTLASLLSLPRQLA